MSELQSTCCTEEQIGLIESIFNKQDIIEKHLIETKILALDILNKLGLSMDSLCETACPQMPQIEPNGLYGVVRGELHNDEKLADIMHILREINSQL